MTEPRVALLVRVPASLKSRLAEVAKHERRSLSKQVELLLEKCLESQGRDSNTSPGKATGDGKVDPRVLFDGAVPRRLRLFADSEILRDASDHRS